jgi:hypothetical protein
LAESLPLFDTYRTPPEASVAVVTETAELAADVPSASVASTVKEYAVAGVRPVTGNELVVDVPIDVPFIRTV